MVIGTEDPRRGPVGEVPALRLNHYMPFQYPSSFLDPAIVTVGLVVTTVKPSQETWEISWHLRFDNVLKLPTRSSVHSLSLTSVHVECQEIHSCSGTRRKCWKWNTFKIGFA